MDPVDFVTRIAQFILYIPSRLLLSIFADFRIEGRDNLESVPSGTGIILASNHGAQFDACALGSALRPFSSRTPIYYVALSRREYKRFPLGKYIYGSVVFTILGAYPIIRGIRDYERSLATHIELLKRGKTISIFPQGRVVRPDEKVEARGGTAYMASVTGAPMIPLAIIGLTGASILDFLLFRRRVTVRFGKPIYFKEIDVPTLPEEHRYHAASENLMRKIEALAESHPLQK